MENHEENQQRLFRKLIGDLCTSGKPSLDEEKIKNLKKICKISDFYIIELYQIVMKYLRKQHAEIRLSSFQICDEIFMRSHCFRALILKNFTNFTELTIGINLKRPLPKPISTAKKLRESAIGAIHKWHEKFSDGYQTLKLGYKFLKDCKNIDFEGLAIITEHDRQRLEELRRKEDEIRLRRVGKISEEIEETSDIISSTLEQFNNCFKLLIPDLPNFFVSNENDTHKVDLGTTETCNESEDEMNTNLNQIEYGSDWMREHGLNKETVIQVNLADIHKVQETLDNEIIILTLKELICNIEKSLLPKVKNWEKIILKYSSLEVELTKIIVDIKNKLESILKNFYSVKIIPKTFISTGKDLHSYSDSDDDSDFIDVPFDDPRVIQATASEAVLLGLHTKDTFSKAEIEKDDLLEAGPSGLNHSLSDLITRCRERNNLEKAKNNFLDIDAECSKIAHFNDPFSFKKTMTGLSQIWAANEALHDHDEDEVKSSGLLGIATRPINYERKWEPIKWKCRFPLLTGHLCPRKDRERCPFHGPIVPRDEFGKPLKLEDAENDQKRQEQFERKNPSWQNPSLLADIKANTGVDLDMKKVRERKKKYPNVTDLKKLQNTPHNRLAKKVLSKKSIRRVNKALNKLPS